MLIAFMIYNDGIGTIIRMAGIYAASRGLPQDKVIVAILLVQVVGIPFAFLFGNLGGRIGTKKAILIGVAAYGVISFVAWRMDDMNDFYLLALLVAMVQGGTQALSRSLFASMVPEAQVVRVLRLLLGLRKGRRHPGAAALRPDDHLDRLGADRDPLGGDFLRGRRHPAWRWSTSRPASARREKRTPIWKRPRAEGLNSRSMVSHPIRNLLKGILDYAGLFPPARLEMALAVEEFDRQRRSETGWVVDRFVVPVGRLEELAAAHAAARIQAIWPLSVLVGFGELGPERKAIEKIEKSGLFEVASVEGKPRIPDEIGVLAGGLSRAQGLLRAAAPGRPQPLARRPARIRRPRQGAHRRHHRRGLPQGGRAGPLPVRGGGHPAALQGDRRPPPPAARRLQADLRRGQPERHHARLPQRLPGRRSAAQRRDRRRRRPRAAWPRPAPAPSSGPPSASAGATPGSPPKRSPRPAKVSRCPTDPAPSTSRWPTCGGSTCSELRKVPRMPSMLRNTLNETHDPSLRSWVASANAAEADFPIQNLPFGAFLSPDDESERVGVAIGDRVVDLFASAEAGAFDHQGDDAQAAARACAGPNLNPLMAMEPRFWSALRHSLSRLLRVGGSGEKKLRLLAMEETDLSMPVEIGDYSDFYASIHHAFNVGSLLRPDQPLMPNYKWIPIGYHGRASSVVLSGHPVRRPRGQTKAPDAAEPSLRADPPARLRARGRHLRGPGQRARLADPDRRKRVAHLRPLPAQRLVGPRRPGLGVPAAGAFPLEELPHLDLALDRHPRSPGALPRSGLRQAGGRSGAAALPRFAGRTASAARFDVQLQVCLRTEKMRRPAPRRTGSRTPGCATSTGPRPRCSPTTARTAATCGRAICSAAARCRVRSPRTAAACSS